MMVSFFISGHIYSAYAYNQSKYLNNYQRKILVRLLLYIEGKIHELHINRSYFP